MFRRFRTSRRQPSPWDYFRVARQPPKIRGKRSVEVSSFCAENRWSVFRYGAAPHLLTTPKASRPYACITVAGACQRQSDRENSYGNTTSGSALRVPRVAEESRLHSGSSDDPGAWNRGEHGDL